MISRNRGFVNLADAWRSLSLCGSYHPFRSLPPSRVGKRSGKKRYKAQVLEPIKPALILPEVLDPSKWYEGEHRSIRTSATFLGLSPTLYRAKSPIFLMIGAGNGHQTHDVRLGNSVIK